ncbi:C-type lectin-like 18 [Homarus americanus]|uniref:C-type lectin-like 18 n=1 Tax=Homarus americanus TaxID=6706 RepID=A0A8J5TKI9_HOMAM|nr:C-type lectin-like 18 [Homarus americanus]
MKAIILFVLTTAVWAEELYVKNEGTPVIFGVGSDGDHIMVDEVFQGRAYHFSWCHNGGRSYTWYDASHHCQRLGNGFQAVSIEHPNEDNFVAGVLRTYQMRDIWTSGSKLGSYQWYWETGVSTGYTNWSNTGRLGRSQPDNADGNEQCLAVVNSLGVGWHDSRCNTLRPVICETEAFYRQ